MPKAKVSDAKNKKFKVIPRCVVRKRHANGSLELMEVGPVLRIFTIDGVAGYVWSKLDGKTPLYRILDGITRTFEVSERRAEKDVNRFIEKLKKLELIYEC